MEYKGYTIDISIFHETSKRTFRATYTISQRSGKGLTGTVWGCFETAGGANSAAEKAALRWIDKITPPVNDALGQVAFDAIQAANTRLDV